MQYKNSKYNIIVPYNGQYLIFNQISKAIIVSPTSNLDTYDPFLYNQGFITLSDENDLAKARINFQNAVNDCSHMNLTVIPTMQCNLRCIYCYETEYHNNQNYLNEDSIIGIVNQIKKNKKLKSLHINWNGGEPMLAINTIYKASLIIQQTCLEYGIKYTSSISSNLYNIDELSLNRLKQSNIYQIETTLAGTKLIHDKVRKSINNSGSFESVWKNIKATLNHNLSVNICINITAENIDDIYILLKQIQTINHKKLFVTFLPVENYGYGKNSLYLNNNQLAIMLKMLNYAINLGLNAELNSNFGCKYVYCSSQHKNSYIIDPNGYLYKCVNYFTAENSIGHIEKDGFVINRNLKEINPYLDDKCKSCLILPYCNGGCNYKKSIGKDPCPLEKDNLNQLLVAYVRNFLTNSRHE